MQTIEIRNPAILIIRTLADFRYEMRRFYRFSEQAALDAGLQPRQHQLLLQVAAAPEHTKVTIAYVADRLGLKHNSTVELVDRSENEGLVARSEDATDRRRTILRVTRKGHQLLSRLAGQHARELNEAAPRLIEALEHIRQHAEEEAE
jgi:DNA-binding MarR family transcriptional regulator